jgi:hypothetical protein
MEWSWSGSHGLGLRSIVSTCERGRASSSPFPSGTSTTDLHTYNSWLPLVSCYNGMQSKEGDASMQVYRILRRTQHRLIPNID